MITIQEILTATELQIMALAETLPSSETTYSQDEFIYIDNKHSITLVAHVDTLKRSKVALQQHNNVITNKHGLLGADDRAGCYAAFKLARYGCNILLTDYEECGGIGAQAAAYKLNFKGVKLFIELDRQGANEYVYYSSSLPSSIKKYMESYGYVASYGSYSDIAELEAFRIPAVNISVGYHNQHTSSERLHLDELDMNIERCKGMILNPPAQLYEVSKATASKRGKHFPAWPKYAEQEEDYLYEDEDMLNAWLSRR